MGEIRYIKLGSCVNVKCSILEKEYEEKEKESRNIHVVGIQVLLKQRFEPGTKLRLEISLPSEQEPLSALGEVAWQEEKKANIFCSAQRRAP